MKIYYNTSGQYRVDESGTKTVTGKPMLRYKEQPVWELHFVDNENSPVNLSGIAAWRAALDKDKSSSTEPMCRTLDAGIDRTRAQYGIIGVTLDANTEPFKTAVDGKVSSVKTYFELWGLDGDGKPVFYVTFETEAYGVVDPDGGTIPSPVPTGLCSIAEINAALVGQFPILGRLSVDGSGRLCLDGTPVCDGSGGGSTDPDPTPAAAKMYYGYIPPSVAGDLASVTEITTELLTAAADTVTEAEPATLSKVSIGTAPIGSFVFVLLPADSGLVATKFDGISSQVAFELDNGASGTGANGTEITVNGAAYKVYGEAMLVTGELFIYVDEQFS